MKQEDKECCPKFKPEKWDEKTITWDHKPFIKSSMPTFFHMPLPKMIAKNVTKMVKLAEDANMLSEDKLDILLLFRDSSPFKSEIYLSVNGNVQNANNTSITGVFMSKVFDGAYKAVPKFLKQMKEYLSKQNKTAHDFYIHYAYCPECAKKFGHNYMALFAQV